jgi:hypothetical protein
LYRFGIQRIRSTPVFVHRQPDKFSNLKAELYWNLREHFRESEITGLTDELTIQQLESIRFEYLSRGRVVIESKEDARKRGVSSADRAEALMLTFANMTPHIFTYYEKRIIYERTRDSLSRKAENRRTLQRTGCLGFIRIAMSIIAGYARGVRTSFPTEAGRAYVPVRRHHASLRSMDHNHFGFAVW